MQIANDMSDLSQIGKQCALYAGGVFLLELFVPEDFPDSPPRVSVTSLCHQNFVHKLVTSQIKRRCGVLEVLVTLQVRFLTQVYHPCVYRLGLICPSAHTVYDMPYQGPWRPTSWGPSMRIIDMIKR